jgi:peptide/nickel transport system substrate-binding protein
MQWHWRFSASWLHRSARLMVALGLIATALAPASAAGASPAAQAAKTVLVIGVDISDTRTLDPHRQFDYSPPITMHATYETLVTMDPGDYVNVKPLLADSWQLSEDGTAWVFHLRPGVRFASGNALTADDVKFSFDRLLNLKDNPASLAENLAGTDVVDPETVRVRMVDKLQPLLKVLISPNFAIVDSQSVRAMGGSSDPGADTADTATEPLNQLSVGTGPYQVVAWQRNAEIDLVRNPNYWRDPAPFERVVIQHIGDSAAQLLALQRGDIDAALNLTPEQLDSLNGTPDVQIVGGTSLDYLYMTITQDATKNPALANKAARQAITRAIDYDGIINGLYGGNAVRPPTFIPVGLGGVTLELTSAIGYHQDLAAARQLLSDAGYPNGFSFDVSYANASIAGIGYQVVAQKLQSDLMRVGITANLKPMDQTNLVTAYRAGQTSSVLTFWNPDAMEPYLWASASVQRVAKRVGWTPSAALLKTVNDAGAATDEDVRTSLYADYQRQLVDEADYVILLQPIYRVATRTAISNYRLTAAGWQIDLYDIQPAVS